VVVCFRYPHRVLNPEYKQMSRAVDSALEFVVPIGSSRLHVVGWGALVRIVHEDVLQTQQLASL